MDILSSKITLEQLSRDIVRAVSGSWMARMFSNSNDQSCLLRFN